MLVPGGGTTEVGAGGRVVLVLLRPLLVLLVVAVGVVVGLPSGGGVGGVASSAVLRLEVLCVGRVVPAWRDTRQRMPIDRTARQTHPFGHLPAA